jgi:SNF2 family DNA or RNA helicase
MDELAEVLSTLRLRRTLNEVGFQLPEQIISKIYVDLEPCHKAIYEGMLGEEVNKENYDVTKGIAVFSYLQRPVSFPKSLGFESYDPKLNVIFGLVEDIAAEGGKVLIFGIHKEFLRHIHWFLNNSKIRNYNGCAANFVHFDGDTVQFTRDELIERFKTDENCIGLVATMKTGGEGLDFPDCDNIITVEGHWNPEVMNQVYGRILRLTSTRNKRVYNIICKNTIDEYIDFVATDKENFISEANQIFKVYQMLKERK